MMKVSRLPLRDDVLERIFKLFIETIVGIRSNKLSESFVYEFFSPTERMMFAKRLAACILLTKGHTYKAISGMLKMSPITISKLSYWVNHEGKGINVVVGQALRKQKKEVLVEEIMDLFDLPVGKLHDRDRLQRKTARKEKIGRIERTF